MASGEAQGGAPGATPRLVMPGVWRTRGAHAARRDAPGGPDPPPVPGLPYPLHHLLCQPPALLLVPASLSELHARASSGGDVLLRVHVSRTGYAGVWWCGKASAPRGELARSDWTYLPICYMLCLYALYTAETGRHGDVYPTTLRRSIRSQEPTTDDATWTHAPPELRRRLAAPRVEQRDEDHRSSQYHHAR